MSKPLPQGPDDEAFEFESLSRTSAPEGAQGSNWHRYVITQGSNTIVGYRQGAANDLRADLDELVERLNQRRAGKTGRVHLTRSPRKRK